uniref:Uncharacterized protein n=1 Tax=Ditylum brightwellii TaxID=49249 RepID=A0A7S1YZJ2_9STRA
MSLMLEEVFQHTECDKDNRPAHFTLIRALAAQDKLHSSIETALLVLEKLGEQFPSPDDKTVSAEYSKLKRILEGKTDTYILGLSAMENDEKNAAMQLLSFLVMYAVLARVKYLPLFSFRMVQLTLRYGVCKESAIGFASFGFLLCGSFNDIKGAYHCGQLALKLMEKLQAKEYMARIHVMVFGSIHSWVAHHRLSLKPLENAYRGGMRCGDTQYALFCAHQYYIHAFQCGEELSALEKEIKTFGDQMLENKQDLFSKYAQVFRQTVLNWMGCCNDPLKLTGVAMDQDQLLNNALENNHMSLVYVIHHSRSYLAFAFGHYELASDFAEQGQNILDSGCSPTFAVVTHAFVYGLISFVLAGKTHQIKWKTNAFKCLKKMEVWSESAPSNCLHKLLLLQAESAVLLGENSTAAIKYNAAIKMVENGGFIHELALIHERAAVFYSEQGDTSKACHHYGQAHVVYLQWGAKGKADDLRINCPF